VSISRDHLCPGTASIRDVNRLLFDCRIDVGERADRAGEFANAIDVRAWLPLDVALDCKANSANFAPKSSFGVHTVVRPVIGMSIESTARRVSASRSAIASVITMSMACVRVAHRAVSTTSEDVKP